MVIGTGISLWRYMAQSQVDSQTHAERLIIHLFMKCLLVAMCMFHVVLMIPWPGLTPLRVAVWCHTAD